MFKKQIFQIANIYVPTNLSSRDNFYKNFLNHSNKNNNQNFILAGDFNMMEDLYLDRQGGTPSNFHLIGQPYLQKIKKYNLIDTWHKIKHAKRIFTYQNYNYSITQPNR